MNNHILIANLFSSVSPFPFKRSQEPLSRKDSTFPGDLFCYLLLFFFLVNHGGNPVKLQAPVVLPDVFCLWSK